MNTRADIEQMLNGYLARFPEDRTKKTAFTDFVAAFDGPALYNRKNFTGHITAGGIVVSRQSGRILLLKHKQLGKWLQPGGHVETGDATVSAAAIREIREETGIRQEQLEPLRFPNETSCLIEVDSHFIPRSDAKKEEAHTHHDMRFAFLFNGEDDSVRIDPNESEGCRWVPLEEFASLPEFRSLAPRIRQLVDLYLPAGKVR